jgi:hypothetical protein
MICDEPSEQDIHETPWTLTSLDDATATLTLPKGPPRKLARTSATTVDIASSGLRVYFQTNYEKTEHARLILGPQAFEKRRAEQKLALRKRWETQGLPGSVTFLHLHSGEMELMLDHEAMRWGRSLKAGDSVAIAVAQPIKAVVREVKPWRERTQLRLVVNSTDITDLRSGQRVALKMTPPSAAVQSSELPPDLGRRNTKPERVEWFLASIYCTCGISGNICTGHFYTLASCNPNGCGQPAAIREQVGKFIDDGKTDEQILALLLKENGPSLLKPHLMP